MSFIVKKFIGDNEVGAAKVRLENNSTLRARNAANSVDLDLMKVSGTDVFTILRNLDMAGSRLLNAEVVFNSAASDPGSPLAGDVYYNTVSNTLKFYNGTVWAPISSSSSTLSVVSKTANYTATTADDVILVNDTSGDITITLPTAVGNSGKVFRVKKTVDGVTTTRSTTIHAVSSQTIDGLVNRALITLNEEYEIVSDGANWRILNHKCDTDWVNTGPNGISSTGSPGPTKGVTAIDNLWWRRVGSNIEIRIEYQQSATTGSAAGTGDYIWQLPTGISVDTAYAANYTTVIGSATAFSPTNNLGHFVSKASTNQLVGGVFNYDANYVRMAGIVTNQANANNSGAVGVSTGALSLDPAWSVMAIFSFRPNISGWLS